MRWYILYLTVVGPKHSVLSMLFQVIALCCYCKFFLAQPGLDKYTLEMLTQMQDIHREPTITENIYLSFQIKSNLLIHFLWEFAMVPVIGNSKIFWTYSTWGFKVWISRIRNVVIILSIIKEQFQFFAHILQSTTSVVGVEAANFG